MDVVPAWQHSTLAARKTAFCGGPVSLPPFASLLIQAANDWSVQVFFSETTDMERGGNAFPGSNSDAGSGQRKHELGEGSYRVDIVRLSANAGDQHI